MDKNVKLAQDTLDFLRENPHLWNQREFFDDFGRTCFGARAVLIGLGLRNESQFRDWQAEHQYEEPVTTGVVAQRLLGWTDEEAEDIFGLFTDDFSELEAAVRRVLEGS